MSTAAVSSASIFQELQSFYQTRQSDVKQLGTALQSGDLAGAQQAYNALSALGQNGPSANAEPFAKSSKAQAFEAVGQALQAGDLAGAQAAFASLTSGNQSNSASAGSATVVSLSSAQSDSAAAADSAASIYQQLQAFREQRKSDVAQLGQALQSGDLAGAQTAFNALTALGASGPGKDGQPFQQSGRASDFQAIGQDLQSGDLAGAQSAFAALTATSSQQNQQAQSAITAYNGTPADIVINFLSSAAPALQTSPPVSAPPSTVGGSGTQNFPEIVINLGTQSTTGATNASASGTSTPEVVINLGEGAGSSSNPEQVTINLSNSSSGEQLSISETQGESGNSTQPVTFNLNPQNNYELVLNLLNSNGSTQAQSNSSSAVSLQA